MPREGTWNPKSLFKICLELIAYRVKDYDPNTQVTSSSNLVEDGKSVSKSAVNPFDELPTYFLEQIINVIESKGWLNINNHQDLLVAANTRKLDISYTSGIKDQNSAALLELAAIRCQQLTSLHMNGVKFSPEYFCKFLPIFKDLQELEVLCSAFNNGCLQTVGIYCKNLLKLNLIGCHEITDDGIESLCGGKSKLGKEMPLGKSGQCKSIQELLISGTQVTQKGVQIALRNLPHLKILEHDQLIEALVDMHKNDEALPKYSLMKLIIKKSDFQSNPKGKCTLRLVASLCPCLICLIIRNPRGITDSNLLGLSALERLSEFKMFDDNFQEDDLITFDGGFAPLFKTWGSSLTKLKLARLSVPINLGILIECCPNLEHLTLDFCRYSSLTGQDNIGLMANRPSKLKKTDFMWEHLLKLKLWAYCDEDDPHSEIPREVLLFMLSRSPSLKHLVIQDCQTLDDDLLRQVFVSHQFKTVEYLDFADCPSITKVGIDLFMDETNLLKQLSCVECRLVSKDDVVDWREKAKTNNWDFQVEFWAADLILI